MAAAANEAAASADRRRRDLVSGEARDEAGLIRFVVGPDGAATPDLGRRLPGRGLWVAADRASIDIAVKKGLFARAARARVSAPTDLADQVERLLARRLLAGLGLARKAGDLVAGFDSVAAALSAGRVRLLIEAADGAADGRRKLAALGRRREPPPMQVGLFSCAELSLALGVENVIHVAYLAGRGAERWTSEAQRLSGFRPLLPEGWREDGRGAHLGRGAASAPLDV